MQHSSKIASDVGTGRIIEKVIATFHVKAGDQVQNIIDWRDVERAEEIFSKRLKESEIMLFNLFCYRQRLVARSGFMIKHKM